MSAPKRGKCFVTSLLPAALDAVRETAGLLPISEIKVVKDTQESLHVLHISITFAAAFTARVTCYLENNYMRSSLFVHTCIQFRVVASRTAFHRSPVHYNDIQWSITLLASTSKTTKFPALNRMITHLVYSCHQ